MVILGGFEKDYHPGHIRNISSIYISGILHSSQGNYGMAMVDYPATLSTTNIAGGTTSATTGPAVYSAYYKTKTFYISAGSFTTHVPGSGMVVNLEGSWSPTSEWYRLRTNEMASSQKWYYTNSEYHPYVRARISGLTSGTRGTWMVNITGTPY